MLTTSASRKGQEEQTVDHPHNHLHLRPHPRAPKGSVLQVECAFVHAFVRACVRVEMGTLIGAL